MRISKPNKHEVKISAGKRERERKKAQKHSPLKSVGKSEKYWKLEINEEKLESGINKK